jgi:hypothetical protein
VPDTEIMMFSATRLFRRTRFSPPRRSAATPLLRARLRVEELEPYNLLSAAVPVAVPNLQATPVAAPADQAATPLAGPGGFAGGPYTPAQIQNAYGFNQLSQTGKGQTIAIVDAYDDPNIVKDLAYFDSPSTGFNLPALTSSKTIGSSNNTPTPTITKMNEFGQVIGGSGGTGGTARPPRANSGWALEISLDVEWAHAIAPQANILLVEANSSYYSDLLQAVQTAVNQGASVVSMSWGGGEFSGETSYDSTYFASLLKTHPNVTFVASSGDTGGVVEWPAVSPYVLSVGGTNLQADANGVYGSESAWTDGGGGVSAVESQPSFQTGIVTQSSTKRTTPDVAYNADPNSGVYIWDSYPYYGQAGWWEIGGTSAGAPQWSGLLALADQGRVDNSGKPLGQAQYAIYSDYKSNPGDFNDIATGSNGFAAGKGYDLATGLGTPLADKLVPHLIGSTATPAAAGTTGGTGGTGGTGSGHAILIVVDATQTAPQTVTVTIATAEDAARGTGAAASRTTAASTAGVNAAADNPAQFFLPPGASTPAAVTPAATPPVAVRTAALPPVPLPVSTTTNSMTRLYAGSAGEGYDLLTPRAEQQQPQRPVPQAAPEMVPESDDAPYNPVLAGDFGPDLVAAFAPDGGLVAAPDASSLPAILPAGREETLPSLGIVTALLFVGGAWKVPAEAAEPEQRRRVR